MDQVSRIRRKAPLTIYIMQKTDKNLLILNGIFITSLLIANVVSAKIVTFGGLVIPAAIVHQCFAKKSDDLYDNLTQEIREKTSK